MLKDMEKIGSDVGRRIERGRERQREAEKVRDSRMKIAAPVLNKAK